jgi:hypothetical protein
MMMMCACVYVLCCCCCCFFPGIYTPISQRRVSLSVAAAAISAGEKVDLGKGVGPEGAESAGMGESWWSYLPAK